MTTLTNATQMQMATVLAVQQPQNLTESLPPGWRKVSTADGRIYYQNEMTKTTQWNIPTVPVFQIVTPTQTLASGWTQLSTADGRIYYQNETTKTTQWNMPTASNIQSITPSPTNGIQHPQTPIPLNEETQKLQQDKIINDDINIDNVVAEEEQNEDEYSDANEKKIYDKEHILLLLTFILTIYDYITDIEVAVTWLDSDFLLCPQLRCYLYTGAMNFTSAARCILITSSIGFIAAIISKIYEANKLYIIYKYPMKKSDELKLELERHRRTIYYGWIPLIVEDMVSVICVWWAYQFGGVGNMKGRSGIYGRAMGMSFFSVFVASILYGRKLTKLQRAWDEQNPLAIHEVDAANKKKDTRPKPFYIQCGTAVCGCSSCFCGFIGFFILYAFVVLSTSPVISMIDPAAASDEYGICAIYSDDTKYEGDRTKSTWWKEKDDFIHMTDVFSCAGDYEYFVECFEGGAILSEDDNPVLVTCTLWTECDSVEYQCEFSIDYALGICQQVVCENSMVSLCFDYCEAT